MTRFSFKSPAWRTRREPEERELLLVGGSPTGRGVVTSASYEARKFGVRSAMPTAEALRLCPGATVVGVPRSACIRKSREIKELLKGLAPVVQAASIDEFYLDLTGTDRLFRESLEATATRIAQARSGGDGGLRVDRWKHAEDGRHARGGIR